MSTLSVPLTPELSQIIEKLIREGVGQNKAEVARKAIEFFAEEQAINAVLKSQQEVKEGKVFSGDLDKLSKKLCS